MTRGGSGSGTSAPESAGLLNPAEGGREVHVSNQSALPIAVHLTSVALFFTAAIALLVTGARPQSEVISSVYGNLANADAEEGALGKTSTEFEQTLSFDSNWYDQSRPVEDIKIDHEALHITERDQGDFTPQAGFEKWRGAPYWMHFTQMPVAFNRAPEELAKEKLVIVGHATERASTPLFMASIHKHGLAAAVSGEGTWWHNIEDKNMGLKAAMMKIPGDPVVIFSDASDSMYTCGPEEILSRFDALGADLVVGTETQCWPPVAEQCVGAGAAALQAGMDAGMEVRSDGEGK
eukprot:CAMPEP_0197597710 /NCGR_PEP_ID=MMETSP1326-20131121/27852_1 /TAXON_ID=1155430 /ORGANISM="Genus nov. species nov., Strain RCC2288" /LENGTH=292 /DNA_ID=CAMNT_0043164415 /DNA_START=70 /DNA_END=945 /DNA_ORIENTATION=+